jgi:GR25 family glycosyltransferase involved in LPS biosynthesis
LFETVFRFAAVSASQHEVAELKRHLALKNGDIKDGILAVLLSHRGAIETAYKFCQQRNETHALILEDDVSLSFSPFWHGENFEYILKNLLTTIPRDWMAVQLGYTRSFLSVDRATKERIAVPNYRSRPRKRSIVKGAQYGAFAYLISMQGMESILRRPLAQIREDCPPMVADDCLLGFTTEPKYHKQSSFADRVYYATPPFFGVNIKANVTHRNSIDRSWHYQLAVSGQCMSLFDNIYWYNEYCKRSGHKLMP